MEKKYTYELQAYFYDVLGCEGCQYTIGVFDFPPIELEKEVAAYFMSLEDEGGILHDKYQGTIIVENELNKQNDWKKFNQFA